jgi:hypothetical protein
VPPLLLERQTSKVKNSKNIEETTPVKKTHRPYSPIGCSKSMSISVISTAPPYPR